MNATEKDQQYRVRIVRFDGARIVGRSEVDVGPAQSRWLPVAVQVDAAAARQRGPGAHQIHFEIERLARPDSSPALVREKSTFVIPR
jgi:hypothetical protein